MSAKKHKQLRRLAREELGTEQVPPNQLVAGKVHGDTSMTTGRNDPFSMRGFVRGMKKAYKAAKGC
jgi:hypothetical protein